MEARRAEVKLVFDGVDITSDLKQFFLSLTYTDNEEDEADDLQLKLQDRNQEWLESWLEECIAAAAAGSLMISADITQRDWSNDGDVLMLPCGVFELDNVSADGPPSTVTIKATSLPYSNSGRQTIKYKAWESYQLSGIAGEIAGNAGLSLMYESSSDPSYDRVEQYDQSDIDFLKKLCHDAGISLKVTNQQLVLFDQVEYERRAAVYTIKKGTQEEKGQYISYKLGTGSANTQYGSCRVSYVDPETGACIEGTATATEDDAKSEQKLEISAKVASSGEAQELAKKNLRLHNKYERTATFNLPGNVNLVAGSNVKLEGFGGWDAKYIIKQAKHTISTSGYTTSITLRRILEGY